jgi:hypothetical protein
VRIYRGRRQEGPPERITIDVYDDQIGRSYPLVENPAPRTAGMEWGFSGTGAHNAARAILSDYLGEFTPELVSAFEQEVIARLNREGFDLTGQTIEDWLLRQRR